MIYYTAPTYEDPSVRTFVTKQGLWDWLKAERQWRDKVHQWLRAEGVPGHILSERWAGRPERPHTANRAARRRTGKSVKRVAA